MFRNTSRSRQSLGLAAIVAATLLGSSIAGAQATYPDRQIKFLVPYAAGGIVDLVSRKTAQYMEPVLGKPVVVENRPGASGGIGTGALAHAPPDGYTIGVVGLSATALLPILDSKLPYDPLKDLVAIGNVSDNETILVARSDLPAANMQQLVELVRASPGKFKYGTAGAGGASQLIFEDIKKRMNLDITAVPYQGDSQALTALAGKHIDLVFGALGSASALVKSGEIKALWIGSSKRVKSLPDVPTQIEAGVPGEPLVNFSAIAVPAGTPQPVLDVLKNALKKAVANPEFQDWLNQQGATPRDASGEDVRKAIQAAMKAFEPLVVEMNIPRN